jgi:hypothetical protein
MAKASPIPRSSLPLPKARLTAANLLSTTVVLEGLIQSVRVVLFTAALVYWDVLIFFRCACSPLAAYERSENENRHH